MVDESCERVNTDPWYSKCRVVCRTRTKAEKTKILYSSFIYALFFLLGWIRGLFGPSFIDLLFISNVDLKQGSWISTTNFIGYGIGSLSGGVLYDKVNRKILYGVCLLCISVIIAVTPFCYIFGLMVAAHFGQGVTNGIVDTAGNAEIMSLWRNNKMMFFCLELMYNVGVFVSPIVLSPFLLDVSQNGTKTQSLNVSQQNVSYSSELASGAIDNSSKYFTFGNASVNMTSQTDNLSQISRIYIPYTITAGIGLCLCLPFFIMYFVDSQTPMGVKENTETEVPDITDCSNDRTKRTLPKKLRIITLLILSGLMFLFIGLGEGFGSYLAVFCVDELGFSTVDGALISSVSSMFGIAAIIVALFVTCVNTLVLNGIHIAGTLVGIVGLLFATVSRFNVGVWISAGVIGYFKSMVFSFTFSWTDEYITPVTGKISSLYMINTCTGSALNPILLGWLMEIHGNLWLCYLFVIEGFTVLLVYIGGVVVTRYITTLYGKTHDRSKSYEISITQSLQLGDKLDRVDEL